MKYLVFGETGQLAQELQMQAGDVTLEVRGLEEADFTNPEACAQWVRETDADAVINAVAYTAVDKAEEEEALALQINATTPALLAQVASERGLPFVHVSTDYVYEGSGEHLWTPDAPTAPINAYGRTKLAGDEAVAAAGGAYAILRTSWVVSAHGHNFIKTMLRLGAERDQLTIIHDQVGAPTPARDLARACLSMAAQLCEDTGKSGIYHMQGAPLASWADFAREIFAQANLSCEVANIPTTDYPTPAARPLNSRLDCATLETVFGIAQPDWTQGLAEILKNLGEAS